MSYITPKQLNDILFESQSDAKWDDFLHRMEENVKAEMHELAGLPKDETFFKKVIGAIRDFLGMQSESTITEGSIKDTAISILVSTLKLPEAALKIFDLGVNFASAIPAAIAGYHRKDNIDEEFIDAAFRPFLVATVGASAAQHAVEVFQLEGNDLAMSLKLIWGMAFVIGAIRGLFKFKMNTAAFLRNIRVQLNNMRDEPGNIEVTR